MCLLHIQRYKSHWCSKPLQNSGNGVLLHSALRLLPPPNSFLRCASM